MQNLFRLRKLRQALACQKRNPATDPRQGMLIETVEDLYEDWNPKDSAYVND